MALPPALRHDVPVLVALLACWLLLPVFWAHVATGLLLSVFVAVHLRTRPRSASRLLSRSRPWGRLGWVALLAVALGTLVTGLLRWIGLPPEATQHAGVSYALLTAAVVHVVLVRRALRARLLRHDRSR